MIVTVNKFPYSIEINTENNILDPLFDDYDVASKRYDRSDHDSDIDSLH